MEGNIKKENYRKEAFLLEKSGMVPRILKDKKRDILESLYLTKKGEELIKLHWYKKIQRGGQILVVFFVLGIISMIQNKQKAMLLFHENYLHRPEKGEVYVNLKIYGREIGETRVSVEVPGLVEEEKEETREINQEIEKSFLQLWQEAYKEGQKSAEGKNYIILPTKVGEKEVYYEEVKDNKEGMLFLLGVFGAGLGFLSVDQKLMEEKKKRERQLALDYPEIINKLILLLGAGMTINGAWERISNGYIQRKKESNIKPRYGYEEMVITWQEIKNGVSEVKAFEDYGRRIRRVEYLKFSTLLSQNLRKGSREILQLLELEASEAFERRKELTKKQGEEAGTKLLLPMVLMLVIVFIIILVPAFIGL